MPLLTTSLIIIGILVLFNIPYETYMIGGNWINQLLGPAIVALAYPLYSQRNTLLKYIYPILGGVIIGSIVGIVSGIVLAKLFALSKPLFFPLFQNQLQRQWPYKLRLKLEVFLPSLSFSSLLPALPECF